MVKKVIQYLKEDVWRVQLDKLPKVQSFFIRQLRVVLVAFRGFNEDRCMLRSSALTFYSLLSVVPVFAMVIGVAKGFGQEDLLYAKIMSLGGYNQDAVLKITEFAHSTLENTKGGLVAGIGVVILFWSVMKVLGNIEASFNDIWEIKRQRPFARKFSDYLSIMLIAPFMFILSTSITGYIMGHVEELTESISFLGFFSPVIFFFMRLVPYALVWLLLAFIYLVMPNTKVTFQAAIAAGIIAGTFFEIAEIVYFKFQVGVAKYNAIYGNFAALPLFLIWLQTSWMIVLFGAEISFASQNVSRYEFESDTRNINQRFKKQLAILIMKDIVQRFKNEEDPETAPDLSLRYSIPIRLVRQIIFELNESKLLVELKRDENEEATYQPAKDIHDITVHDVIQSLENLGSSDIPVEDEGGLAQIRGSFEQFETELGKSTANVPLMKL